MKHHSFEVTQRQTVLPKPTADVKVITSTALALLKSAWPVKLRLIGVRMSSLLPAAAKPTMLDSFFSNAGAADGSSSRTEDTGPDNDDGEDDDVLVISESNTSSSFSSSNSSGARNSLAGAAGPFAGIKRKAQNMIESFVKQGPKQLESPSSSTVHQPKTFTAASSVDELIEGGGEGAAESMIDDFAGNSIDPCGMEIIVIEGEDDDEDGEGDEASGNRIDSSIVERASAPAAVSSASAAVAEEEADILDISDTETPSSYSATEPGTSSTAGWKLTGNSTPAAAAGKGERASISAEAHAVASGGAGNSSDRGSSGATKGACPLCGTRFRATSLLSEINAHIDGCLRGTKPAK